MIGGAGCKWVWPGMMVAVCRPASVDEGPPHTIEVERPTLYTLLDGATYGEHLLEFVATGPGLPSFSATIG